MRKQGGGNREAERTVADTTLRKIFDSGLANDNTNVRIRDSSLHVVVYGNWYQDCILKYLDDKVESFTWQDNENLYVNVK